MLGAESLDLAGSGIGRVARLMAKVLSAEQAAGKLSAHALCLHGHEPISADSIAMRSAGGSRARFAASTHIASPFNDVFLYDFAGIARAHCVLPGLHRPFLTWIHGIEVWEEARPNRVRRAALANVLLANSRYTRERAAALHPELARARVCWLATEDDSPAPAAIEDRPPVVMIVARMDSAEDYKGHRELIECWPRVVQAVPGSILRIIGSGTGRAAFERLAEASGVRDRIEFAGFVPEAEIAALWQQAVVFAMPSRGEGFGLAYIEAMRCGVPVLGSVHDAAGEVNLDGTTGYNVDLERPDELSERIVQLLRDRDLATRLGTAGRARWRQHFRFSEFQQRFTPFLYELLQSH